MATTDFSLLSPAKKMAWQRELWTAAREKMFLKRFIGNDENSMVQRVRDLTKTERGEQVVIQLVADLVDDGVIGDNEREGNEESMNAYAQVINIDLITHGVVEKGKMATQKSIVNFRERGLNLLSNWLAYRCDQLAFLTMAGISYAFTNNGAPRTGSPFPNLSFAADVSGPTSKRALMYDGTSLVASNTANIASTYVPKYGMIVDLIAYAKEHFIKPLMAGGKEYYVLLVQPGTLAQLKKDQDYQRAVVTGAPRGLDNPWFTGATITIDGAVIHEHRLVYNTKGAASGSKWGAGGNVNGTRSMLCGAQALAMADLGPPEWEEKTFQYGSRLGINVDKMFGLLKPKFYSIHDKSVEDFGIVTVDHYLQ